MHRAYLARGQQRGLQSSANSGRLSIARLRISRPPAGMQTRLSRRVFALWVLDLGLAQMEPRAQRIPRATRRVHPDSAGSNGQVLDGNHQPPKLRIPMMSMSTA